MRKTNITKHIYCDNKVLSFGINPNPPEKFELVSISENEIIINWLPPVVVCLSADYEVTIEPFDGTKSIASTKRQAVFGDLFPGRLYNVTVKTVSNNKTSVPIKMSCRTRPMPPSDVTIEFLSVTPTGFRVNWTDPKVSSEFDGYEISLTLFEHNRQPFDPNFKSISVKRDAHSWEFKNLQSGVAYRAIVQTVSGGTYSQSATRGIYLEPMVY